MAGGTHEERLRFVEAETGLTSSEAEALLAQASKRQQSKQSQTRNFVVAISDVASEAVGPVLVFHGILVAGTLALAYYLATTSRLFFAVVCAGLAVTNLVLARSALLRSRRRTGGGQAQPGDEPKPEA